MEIKLDEYEEVLQSVNKMIAKNRKKAVQIIWDLIEDTMELSQTTLENIKEAEEDIKHRRVYTHDEIKKELGL